MHDSRRDELRAAWHEGMSDAYLRTLAAYERLPWWRKAFRRRPEQPDRSVELALLDAFLDRKKQP